jgi:hypothetical protein
MSFEGGFNKPSVRPVEIPPPTPESIEGAETLSPYDFERLSPELRAAVTYRLEKMFESTPIGSEQMSAIFNIESGTITPEQVAYFKSYSYLAARQLVMGDFFGPEEPIQEESSVLHELHDRPLRSVYHDGRTHEQVHLAQSFGYGSDLVHDIAHTWIDLAQTESIENPANMVPKFLRYKQSIESNKEMYEASAHDEDIASLYNTEDIRTRGGVLKSISKAKSRAEFLDHDYMVTKPLTETQPHALKTYIRGRVFDEYKENPDVLFDIFLEATLPLMKKYAPAEAAPFEYK